MFKRLFVLLCFIGVAHAQPAPSAKSVLVIDADTHETLFQKNHEDVRPIASITKLMNAVVVLEGGQSLDEPVEITKEDVLATFNRRQPTGTSLGPGTTLTRAELLHLALMSSHNRAAHALARTFPGGVDSFIEAMNAKAIALGMSHTTFTDPTGLYNTNVSTAEDLAKLIGAASEFPVIRDFSTSTSFQTTQYVRDKPRVVNFTTTNGLARTPDWNLIVQKTGFINDAGRCMVVMTTIGARRVVMVLLNTPSSKARIRDAINLRYWIEHKELMPAPVVKAKYKKRKRK